MFILSCLLIGAIGVLCFVPHKKTKTVEFVFPQRFLGIIKVKYDKSGDPPKYTKSGILFEVPESGIVITNDGTIFNEWYILRGRFNDGVELPDALHNKGSLIFDALDSSSDGWVRLFVGTKEELDSERKK